MKLYTYYRSSASCRVRIALNLKQIKYEHICIDLKNAAHQADEFAAINPQQFVPVLQADDTVITQSLSIIHYLETQYPEPSVYGGDALETARIQSAAQIIACDIHPLDNLRVLNYLKHHLRHDQDAVDDWYRHWVVQGLQVLEQLVRPDNANAPFCFGNRPSLADICLAPQMYNARRFAVDLSPYPRLCGIDEQLLSLPAFADAMPDKQPDAP
ncbi:MAG: maleylacetoacetate isomerase [Gammaproteobacteria bacterium]